MPCQEDTCLTSSAGERPFHSSGHLDFALICNSGSPSGNMAPPPAGYCSSNTFWARSGPTWCARLLSLGSASSGCPVPASVGGQGRALGSEPIHGASSITVAKTTSSADESAKSNKPARSPPFHTVLRGESRASCLHGSKIVTGSCVTVKPASESFVPPASNRIAR